MDDSRHQYQSSSSSSSSIRCGDCLALNESPKGSSPSRARRISWAFLLRFSSALRSSSAFRTRYALLPTTFSGFLHNLSLRSTCRTASTSGGCPVCIIRSLIALTALWSVSAHVSSTPDDLESSHFCARSGDASDRAASAIWDGG